MTEKQNVVWKLNERVVTRESAAGGRGKNFNPIQLQHLLLTTLAMSNHVRSDTSKQT